MTEATRDPSTILRMRSGGRLRPLGPALAGAVLVALSACAPDEPRPRPEPEPGAAGGTLALPVCQEVEGWAPRLAPEDTLGLVAGVALDPEGRVVAFRRAGRPFSPVGETPIDRPAVLVLEPETGEVVTVWGADRFYVPHSIAFDAEGNTWIADTGLHQVMAFAPDGSLLMEVGEALVPGADDAHFDRPSGVVVADDGSFYVSDGYGNARVVHYSPEGERLGEWGEAGDGEGQLQLPHGVVLGRDGNVYVADRENARIQAFDRQGRFLRMWDDPELGRPYAIYETGPESIWGGRWLVSSRSIPVDGRAWSRVNVVDSAGRVVGHFAEREGGADVPLLGHGIAVGEGGGAVYLSGSQGLVKFRCQ